MVCTIVDGIFGGICGGVGGELCLVGVVGQVVCFCGVLSVVIGAGCGDGLIVVRAGG